MKVINKILEKICDVNFFKLVFLIVCFFYCIPFTNDFLTKIFKIFIFWGFLSFLFNYLFNKKYTLRKSDYLLFVFLAISFVGCIINYPQNFILNVTVVVYLFIQTILLLSYEKNDDLKKKIKEINLFSLVIIVLTFICAVLSLLIFLFNFKYSYADGFQQILFGVFEGRLWGIYGNPNTLGHYALISIWLSVLLLTINRSNLKTKFLKLFLYLNIIIEMVCCILSNSRSTALGALASLVMFAVFAIALKTRKNKQQIWKTILKNKLTVFSKVLIVVVSVVLVSTGIKQTMLLCSTAFQNINLNFIEETSSNKEITSKDENESVNVDREYVTSDYSNGRFELWKGGFKVFEKNPLFGVGSKNINNEVNAYLSEETVSSSPKLSENMHNIFIQILVAHGILALIIFVIYIMYNILKQLNFLLRFDLTSDNNVLIYKLVTIYFSILCALLVINLFDSNILYFCSVFLVFVFWTSISNINSLLDHLENESKAKKTLIMIDSLETGGAEKALIDLTKNLNYSNYELHVMTVYNEGKYIEDLDDRIIYSSIIKRPNIWKKRIFYRLVKYMPSKLMYQLIVDEKYDVEIAFHELLSTKILSGSSSSAFKVAWIHTNMFLTDKPYQMFNNHISFVKGYDSFGKIVCVSDNIRYVFNDMTNLYQKTMTIYNPIDKKKIITLAKISCEVKKQKDKFVIISIGRLEKVKGYHKLLKVINEIKEKYRNLELWILGDGNEREALNKFIINNNLEDIVKLYGFKANPYNYLKQADLFISTSSVEGFSLVVAEAIVLGLPVISTNTDGPKEILENGKYGMLIENTEEALKTAIESVLGDKELLLDLKKKSAVRKEYFELSDTINKFDSLMELKGFRKKTRDIFCTVFTPSYNRAYILPKLYESLKRQTDKDFEWVVVDDGSADDTEELFKKWSKEKKGFNINYLKVQNGGKQKAVNKGLDLAKGKMFFIVDSDDFLTDYAIEYVKKYEKTILKLTGFAGVAGLRGYTNGTIIGGRNKNEFVDCTNLERLQNNLWGDKAEIYYTDLLKKYKFPEVPNEKFVTECVVWDKIAYDGYKMRWFSDVLTNGEYLEDGLTKDGMSLYYKSPTGYLIYIRNEVKYYPFDLKRKMGNYYRYYLVTKDKKNIKEISKDLLTNTVFLRLVITLYKLIKK